MKDDSLEQLGAAFSRWRRKKGHRREPTPAKLVRWAGEAAGKYGRGRVVQAAKIDGRRILKGPGRGAERGESPNSPPVYSRLQLAALAADMPRPLPFAELEWPSGVRLRLYSGARETMEFLSSMCTSEVGQ